MPGAPDYVDGTYLQQNPDWHVPDSAWKVQQILRILIAIESLRRQFMKQAAGRRGSQVAATKP